MVDMSEMRRSIHAALVVLVVTVLAACGSGGSDDSENVGIDAGPGDPDAAATEVAVSAFEFGYEMTAPTEAGTYTFVLTNDGTQQHDLVLEGGPGGATAIIGAGETDSFTATLEPGDYTLYCSVGSHRSQGMEVTFTVS